MSYQLAGRTLYGAGLAPMAGLTDLALRRIADTHGAAFTVSEMVSAKALVMGDDKTRTLCTHTGGSRPYGIQLFGDEPEVMTEAAAIVTENFRPDFLDLNIGCPAPKIAGNGAGSALMRTPDLCGRLVEGMAKAGLPVTVKMRTGYDTEHLNAPEVARICVEAGAQLVAVHGRSRDQQYTPPIHPEQIARVVEAVPVPVLGNGDIHTAQDALELMRITGCAGVLVGRGALGNPWLFGQIDAAVRGLPLPPAPTLAQRMALLCAQAKAMCADKGEVNAMRQMRSQAAFYMKGLRGAAKLRGLSTSLTVYEDAERLAALVLELNSGEETEAAE
jgi:tRNA-dihydrouridine synthase B